MISSFNCVTDDGIRLRSEMGVTGSELKKQKSLNVKTFHYHETIVKETEGIQETLSDELEAEKELNKYVPEEYYSWNIQSVLLMLLAQSKASPSQAIVGTCNSNLTLSWY